MFGGRKTVYTAWKKLQKGANGGYLGTGWGVTWRICRAPRTDERVTHEIKRAFRWLKSNHGRCYVATEGAHKGERRIAASRRVPAHIREAIGLNWSVFAE